MALYILTFTKPLPPTEDPYDAETLTFTMEATDYNRQYLTDYYVAKGYTLDSEAELSPVLDELESAKIDSTGVLIIQRGEGDPTDSVTPFAVPSLYFDTVSSGIYISTAITTADWAALVEPAPVGPPQAPEG